MAEQLLLAERAARVQLERQLADARATIASLQMQLSPVLSDCSDLSTTQKKSLAPKKGVRKKKAASKEPKVKIPGQSRYWTPEEHKLFLEALRRFGHKDLRSISAYVGTRNMTQVRTHSQKYFMRLMREAKRQNPNTAAVPANTASTNNTTAGTGMGTPVGTSDADSDPAPQRSRTPNAPDGGKGTAEAKSSDEQKHNINTAAQPGTTTATPAPAPAVDPNADKYSVPNTCGMTLLCLVGQDTLTN